jgi:hypothetical protein
MTAEELADKFGAKGRRWPRRAVCPVHTMPGTRRPAATLAIYKGDERASVWCPAGCKSDDVLSAVGLTWKDTIYAQREKLSPADYNAARRKSGLRALKDLMLYQIGLVIMLQAVEPAKRGYWAKLERTLRSNLFFVRWELEQKIVEEEIMQRWDWTTAAINYGRKLEAS